MSTSGRNWTSRLLCPVRHTPGSAVRPYYRKNPRLAAVFLCVGRSRIYLAQLVMHIGVSRNGRTDVDADRRCVDQLDLFDPLGLDRKDMRRQTGPRNMRLQPGHKAFQNQRRLARAGHAGHDREPALRNFRLQRLYRMDSRRGQADFSRCKHRSGTFLPPGNHRRGGEERPDLRIRTCPNVLHGVPCAIMRPPRRRPPAPAQ